MIQAGWPSIKLVSSALVTSFVVDGELQEETIIKIDKKNLKAKGERNISIDLMWG
jgi:hypothetical protein